MKTDADVDAPGSSCEEPIRRPRVSEEVVRRLERAIREGHYAVGERLPSERDLMQHYGVGRSAVREALYTLRKSGLVELKSGSRPLVTEPTTRTVLSGLSASARYYLDQPSGVRNFQFVRQLFEIVLAREAAVRASGDDLRRMREALAANRSAMGDRDLFIHTDVAFHFTLAARTRNPVVIAIHDAMAAWLDEQRAVALMRSDLKAVSLAQHEEIYRAVESGDADAAEAAMRKHLDLVAKNYWTARTH